MVSSSAASTASGSCEYARAKCPVSQRRWRTWPRHSPVVMLFRFSPMPRISCGCIQTPVGQSTSNHGLGSLLFEVGRAQVCFQRRQRLVLKYWVRTLFFLGGISPFWTRSKIFTHCRKVAASERSCPIFSKFNCVSVFASWQSMHEASTNGETAPLNACPWAAADNKQQYNDNGSIHFATLGFLRAGGDVGENLTKEAPGWACRD